ncbi:hypothetical protein BJF83_17505 [Nocardiopsis sp. CNR-923]|uniref:hypothetical protein n=1 Tax=Nocardiopsis sp. CNR-923 TaxID=1904965 RepID=UPI000966B633|nr:hypothetical protein [Nocardiopsis sp. CNR-923]OLT27780.1 hypothetical protein BJF83_17505 [Nocardiopsis sp. CNR-923]
MALKPWPDARDAAARAWRAGRIARDSMSPREAALAAYSPGGLPVEQIEALIIQHRAEARAARDAQRAAA